MMTQTIMRRIHNTAKMAPCDLFWMFPLHGIGERGREGEREGEGEKERDDWSLLGLKAKYEETITAAQVFQHLQR